MNNNPLNFMFQVMQLGNNPNAIIQQLLNNNPNANYMRNQLNAIRNQMQQNNMTTEDMVRQLAKQNNVDLSPFINLLANKGIRM